MPVLPTAPFTCTVVRVHDGDGPLWCANGIKVRIAGVQAPDYEDAEPCRRQDARRANYICDNAAADRSREIVERMLLRETITCQPLGKSYARVVARCIMADGRSLSCAVIAAGAAVRWARFWRQYRMGACRRARLERKGCAIVPKPLNCAAVVTNNQFGRC